MKIRLHIGVASVFTLLTLAITTTLVGMLYFGNKNLAIRTAQERMEAAREGSVENMLRVMRHAGDVVSSASVFFSSFPEEARSLVGLEVLQSYIQGQNYYYGLYFADEQSGNFYQNVNLPEDWSSFGPDERAIPEGTRRAQRIITDTDRRVETFYWVTSGDPPRPFFSRATEYDPRARPWYRGAVEKDAIYITPPYQFESTGGLGVTFSKSVFNHNGDLLGVVALDMTMSALSQILNDIRIGDFGVAFMLDREGRLLSYTGTRAGGTAARFISPNANGGLETNDSLVSSAVAQWQANPQEFFSYVPSSQATPHIVSIAPIPEVFGAQPTLGLIVPEAEFVREITRTTARALQFGGLALFLAVGVTLIVSRMLSKNLARVAAEARKVSAFELGDDLNLKSKIQEVAELESAVANMKAGLSSFGAYVPKELVRSIVSKAQKISVGGDTQDVTLMFSDLQGFTSRTEGLEPEILMPALSEYFEVMEKEISARSGTVDKYMGDAIMALWNAPLEDPNHADHACMAALACLQAEAGLNSEQGKSKLRPLHTRFGLHSGRVIVGNVGSLSRMQYTALGGAVNFASRLENLNKIYGTRILLSEATEKALTDAFVLREIDIVVPFGTSKPSRIFELLGIDKDESRFCVSEAKKREVEGWRTCYSLYQSREWHDALHELQKQRELAENKRLIETFIDRCTRFIAEPPRTDWDGVYRLDRK